MSKTVETKNKAKADKHAEQKTTTAAATMTSTHHDTDAVAHSARAHGEPLPQTFNDPSIQEDG